MPGGGGVAEQDKLLINDSVPGGGRGADMFELLGAYGLGFCWESVLNSELTGISRFFASYLFRPIMLLEAGDLKVSNWLLTAYTNSASKTQL